MASLYDLSAEAQNDLFEIWRHIAAERIGLAGKIDKGCPAPRGDLTKRPVLFFPLYSFLVIYRPQASPIRILGVLRGSRNV